jgi:hypothetical protein
MWVVAVMTAVGCPGSPVYNNLFPPDPTPAPKPPPCTLITETTTLQSSFFGDIPDGMAEDDVFTGALQFLTTAGARIDTQDAAAHTIVTARVFGQIIQTTCGVNSYHVFVFRIAVVGKRMIVAMDCFRSTGMWNPAVATRCYPELIAKSDADLQRTIFDGTISMVNIRRDGLQHEAPGAVPLAPLFRPAALEW